VSGPEVHPCERLSPAPAAAPAPSTRSGADQRSRLLDSIVAVVCSHGYAGARIGDIAARAGVSRSTFYELFDDKQACFMAAHRRLAGALLDEFAAAVAAAEPPDAAHAALAAIARLAERQPRVLAFLTHEALLAGPEAISGYECMMASLRETVEARLARTSAGEAAPAIPVALLLGGAARLCCLQLRRGGRAGPETLPALLRWADAYRAVRDRDGWTAAERPLTGAPTPLPARRCAPRVLPRGRHRLPRDVVATIQRERIAHAAAEAVMGHGGTGVAVADIVAAAGVSREVFYAHFADKEQAFLATQQLIFEQLIAVASSAFFVPDTPWAERVWNATAASAGLFAANPSFAHFAFVAAYGIGATGVRRVDETLLAFGLFLEDGYRALPEPVDCSRITSEAIVLAVMEAAAHHVRSGRAAELGALVPSVVYTALAPFIGPVAARALVERQLDAPTATAPDRRAAAHR